MIYISRRQKDTGLEATMKTEFFDVIEGNFRIRCYSIENATGWITFIINKGGVPRSERGTYIQEAI
jgi:hypothetical protein